MPESVVSDRRSQFVAELMKELNRMLGDRDEVVNSVPPTNKWADGTNEPRVRAIT